MPKKCGVAECNGNYNSENKCRVFRLPKDAAARQKWLDVLPVRDDFVLDPEKFIICERHWNPDPPMIKLPGGSTRPSIPPSVFPNVPKSCLPTPKPEPRTTNKEDKQLRYFLQKDKIASFEAFSPEKELHKTYKNVIIHRSSEKIVCLFMSENFHECRLTVIVENKPTLCSPLILSAYKDGVSVSLGKILNPNRGLASYSQFYEAVRLAVMFEVPLEEVLKKVVCALQGQQFSDMKKEKKLKFLTHQLELLDQKQFSMSDYCFAVETFPRCSYEQLREYLVLPSKTKVQGIVASVDRDKVKDFIDNVSRSSLKVPHVVTFDFVRLGLRFVKKARHRACCRKRLELILGSIACFHDIDSPKVPRRLSNVLLSGIHNLEKDHQRNAVLLQTSVKRARLAN